MPIAKLADVDLYYEIHGETGPWLIFAHGGGDVCLTWWRQVAHLKDRYRCVIYDARFHGRSSVGTTPAESDQVGWKDLLGLMDALNIGRALLNGHSMGGGAVSGLALNHPERVRAVVMTDCVFGFSTPALQRWAAEMIDKIPKGFNVMAATTSPGYAARDPEGDFLHLALERLNPPRPTPRDSRDYLKAYERMRDQPPGDYSGFSTPVLFVLSEDDGLQVPWLIEATAKAVKGAELARIAGSGHAPHWEQPERYLEVLGGFLDRHRD
jgi:pimeloyl-ACP methyl ester carboxylesterase